MAVKKGCAWHWVLQLDDVAKDIEALFYLIPSPKENIIDKLKLLPKLAQFASWMPESEKRQGRVPGNCDGESNINKLPVITCWPKDGGPFVTLPIIHTKDPHTNSRNVGMYR